MKQVELENLRKEHLQNDQIVALRELSKLSHNLRPTIWSSPDYDSDEAYTDVLFSLGSFLGNLDDYLRTYRYIVPSSVLSKLEDVLFKCNSSHWQASGRNPEEYTPTRSDLKDAENILDLLSEAESEFKVWLGLES
ncbi:hypothetical protein CGH18_24035 [Vibrio parahaemolyticus]|nr:hypothetical protein CGH18_24035 [Vibrio parahaemolyticus]